MFRVSLDSLVFLYLVVFLTLVFAVWVMEERRRQLRIRRSLRDRVYCSVCAYDFEDATSDPLPICPRCGARNERPRTAQL